MLRLKSFMSIYDIPKFGIIYLLFWHPGLFLAP